MGTKELEDLLHTELRAQVEDVELPQHVFDRAVRRHERYRKRRRAATLTGAGTAGVAVVAVGALAVTGSLTWPGRSTGAAASGAVTAGPSMETVADIRPKVERALDASHAIIRTTAHASFTRHKLADGGGRKPVHIRAGRTPLKGAGGSPVTQTNDNWLDPETGYITCYTYEGHTLTSAIHYPQSAAGTQTSVDYRAHTWSVEHQQASSLPDIRTGKLGEPLLDSVAGIRAAVDRPDIKIVGHQRVRGHDATHLRFSITRAGDTVTGDAWFDSTTYVPLRATTTYGAGTPAATSTTTRFLPRTATNLAKTTLTVPDGFRKAARPNK